MVVEKHSRGDAFPWILVEKQSDILVEKQSRVDALSWRSMLVQTRGEAFSLRSILLENHYRGVAFSWRSMLVEKHPRG